MCKQKAAYAMGISDWSSDVCASDLIVAERCEVRLAMSFLDLAGLEILLNRYGRVVDRPKVPHKTRPGDAQANLKIAPGSIGFLCLQHLAHGIPDRDQLADDPNVFFRDSVT